MDKKLRPPTREDWNDISKLRFRDFDAKIIAVNVFDESIGLSSYNVRVIYSLPNGVKEITEHSIAGKWFPIEGRNRNKDIVIEEPEEIDYEEIVVELIKNKVLLCSANGIFIITFLDTYSKTFNIGNQNFTLDSIEHCRIITSTQNKQSISFQEYLELRAKEQDNG